MKSSAISERKPFSIANSFCFGVFYQDKQVGLARLITDKASFESGLAFSEGMEYVLVNGKIVLKNGKTLSNTFPGQPIYGKFKN